jgi:plastocyanin
VRAFLHLEKGDLIVRMRLMKFSRSASLILVVVALAAAGCGGGGDSSSSTTDQTAAEEAPPSASDGKKSLSAYAKAHPGAASFGSPPLEFEADPDGDLAYTTDEVTAKEGNVTIEFTNPQSVPHNVAIEAASGGKVVTETVTDGFAAVTITLNTKEKFIFYCTVPGHREAGMEGIVNVEPR